MATRGPDATRGTWLKTPYGVNEEDTERCAGTRTRTRTRHLPNAFHSRTHVSKDLECRLSVLPLNMEVLIKITLPRFPTPMDRNTVEASSSNA